MSVADNALTTLTWLKTRLGISGSTYDTQLETFIDLASDLIEHECDRQFQYIEDVEEDVAGFGTMFLRVKRTPIVAINSITYNSGTVASSQYEIHNANAGLIRNVNGSWYWTAPALGNIGQDPYPGAERKLYTVDYDGGYVLPNDGGTVTLPKDLQEACVQVCRALWFGDRRDPMVKSEKLLSWAATYLNESNGDPLPPFARAVINRYKRRV